MEGKTLGLAVGAIGVIAIVIGTMVLYAGEPGPTPERPKAPPPPEVTMNTELKFSQPVYQGLLEGDAKKFKVPAPTLQEIAQPNPYFEEFKGKHRLKVGQQYETAHIRLSLEVQKRKGLLEGQSFAVDHLVLRLTNRAQKFLAYRVETAVSDKQKCASKGDIAHNALVMEPGQTIERTECLYRTDQSIEVLHIEVIELPPLSAHYVSRLPPNPTLYDSRTSSGHVPLEGGLCPQTFSWREIKDGIDKRQIGWRDVMDFYARHNCDEYSFFAKYRYRNDAAAALPARPLD
jgi:hypothetical protein